MIYYMSYLGLSNIIFLSLTYSKFVKYVKNNNYMGNLSSVSISSINGNTISS